MVIYFHTHGIDSLVTLDNLIIKTLFCGGLHDYTTIFYFTLLLIMFTRRTRPLPLSHKTVQTILANYHKH